MSRTSEQEYDHENYLQQSPPSTDKDKRKEFTSIDNSTQKSPIKDSHLKYNGTEISRTSPPQTALANGSTGTTLELSKNT